LNISVLGCGRWGSFLAWYVDSIGHQVVLWGREGSANYQQLLDNHGNSYGELSERITLTSDLSQAVRLGDCLLISISAQQLRSFCQVLKVEDLHHKQLILCMKGLEEVTGKRLSTIVKEELGSDIKVAVWLGPGHVQDFRRGIPNCMVLTGDELSDVKDLINELSSNLIRFYVGTDLIGNEVGGAAKNVIGIAAGILDGLGYNSLKGALMARGAREIACLIKAMGGQEITAYGLTHLGDYEATLFSPHSQNRAFGEHLVHHQTYQKLAEGATTVKALMCLAQQYQVELPITQAVNQIINDPLHVNDALLNLLLRPIKQEF
jgi:glycerol-3-phosphate dehydrogenase (NAD(P)+)